MQSPPPLAGLVLRAVSCNCAVSVHAAPIAAGGLSLSSHSRRVITKRPPPSAEQGFPTFLESRAAAGGHSIGVDGSLLAANSYPTPQEPGLPGFLRQTSWGSDCSHLRRAAWPPRGFPPTCGGNPRRNMRMLLNPWSWVFHDCLLCGQS